MLARLLLGYGGAAALAAERTRFQFTEGGYAPSPYAPPPEPTTPVRLDQRERSESSVHRSSARRRTQGGAPDHVADHTASLNRSGGENGRVENGRVENGRVENGRVENGRVANRSASAPRHVFAFSAYGVDFSLEAHLNGALFSPGQN